MVSFVLCTIPSFRRSTVQKRAFYPWHSVRSSACKSLNLPVTQAFSVVHDDNGNCKSRRILFPAQQFFTTDSFLLPIRFIMHTPERRGVVSASNTPANVPPAFTRLELKNDFLEMRVDTVEGRRLKLEVPLPVELKLNRPNCLFISLLCCNIPILI